MHKMIPAGLSAVLLIVCASRVAGVAWTCPAQCGSHHVCANVLTEEECPPGSLWNPTGGTCGCCGACVRYAGEQESCYDEAYATRTIQEDGTIFIQACNPELHDCLVKKDVSPQKTCAKKSGDALSGPCLIKNDEILEQYDAAVSGGHATDYFVFPTCTKVGEFTPVQKMARPKLVSRYFCVNKVGNRIFGDAYEEMEGSEDMNCECSVTVSDLKDREPNMHVTLSCDIMGNFRQLQCQNDVCFCVNATSSIITGPFVPKASWQMLPCYDEQEVSGGYFGGPKTCGAYREMAERLKKFYLDHGTEITGLPIAACGYDHTYAPLFSSSDATRCLNPDGAETAYSSSEGNATPDLMDCHCARDIYILNDAGLSFGQLNCEGYGSYKVVQQSGSTKTCVTKDGVRCSSIYTAGAPLCCLPCTNAICRPTEQEQCGNLDSSLDIDYCTIAAWRPDSYQ